MVKLWFKHCHHNSSSNEKKKQVSEVKILVMKNISYYLLYEVENTEKQVSDVKILVILCKKLIAEESFLVKIFL